ncbi:hypothetical protein FBEOM_3331 [Fusarium beomiforme]|uniref:Uncharacterized protein n=1 Tax=Fusarium beomiforme TaxID=44412 RepID=A0A9P5DZ59_9HYPO|nr:hypothetical protein FBEOM_3331 [Fusarium beomiforme]
MAPAMESPPMSHSSRAPAIEKLLQEWKPLPHPVKSPEEEFQESCQEAQRQYEAANAAYGQGQGHDAFTKLEEALACGSRLKELMAAHKANKEEKEREYQQIFLKQQGALFFGLLDLFGRKLGERLCKTWLAHRTSNDPAKQGTITTSEGNRAAHQTTYSDFELATNTAVQPATVPDRTSQNPTNEATPIHNTVETSRDQEARTGYPSLEEAQEPSRSQNKRPPTSPHTKEPRPPKRPRSNVAETNEPLTGDRTIHFDDVFQDGNAATKYVITEYKGNWYILECRKHRMHFRSDNPIRGAWRHLRSSKHDHLQPNYDGTIRLLGTQVLGCTKRLADRNNELSNRPSYENIGRPLSSVSATGSTSPSGPRTRSSRLYVDLDPQPGEIYTTFWPDCKKYFAILVLPWGNFHSFGWEMTLKQTGLLGPRIKVPACYKYDPVTETAEWADEYKPGGKHYHKRKYPVLFFDMDNFPWNCGSWWLPVRDFCPYDPDTRGIPFKDKVDQFLIMMQEREQVRNVEGWESDAGPDESNSAHDNTPHQQTSAVSQSLEAPPEGASLGRVIVIHDSDSEDEDGPHWTFDYHDEPDETARVKVERTNQEDEEAYTTEAPAVPTRSNLAGLDEMHHQRDDISPGLDTGLGLQPTSVPCSVLPTAPALEAAKNIGNPSSCVPHRSGDERSDNLSASHWSVGSLGEHQPITLSEITNQSISTDAASNARAPEAMMTPSGSNQSSSVPQGRNPPTLNRAIAPAPLNGNAQVDNGGSSVLYSPVNQNPNVPHATANNALRWTSPMTPNRGPLQPATVSRPEVALGREIDYRNAAARLNNWRQPFITDDTD